MGIFDKLLKEGAEALKKVATEENKEKAANFLNSLKEGLGEAASGLKEHLGDLKEELNKEKTPTSTTNDESYYEEDPDDSRSCHQKLLDVLAAEFPQFTVKEDVSPLTIGGHGRFMNYSIGVYQNEEPKLFIMEIGKTTCTHREYRWSKEAAERNGIVFLNFIKHYPNRKEYIKDRLHKYL